MEKRQPRFCRVGGHAPRILQPKRAAGPCSRTSLRRYRHRQLFQGHRAKAATRARFHRGRRSTEWSLGRGDQRPALATSFRTRPRRLGTRPQLWWPALYRHRRDAAANVFAANGRSLVSAGASREYDRVDNAREPSGPLRLGPTEEGRLGARRGYGVKDDRRAPEQTLSEIEFPRRRRGHAPARKSGGRISREFDAPARCGRGGVAHRLRESRQSARGARGSAGA